MSESSVDGTGPFGPGVRALLARAAGADQHARAALKAAIDDAFLSPELRLDDRTRAALTTLLDALAGGIERELRDHAAKLLIARGAGALAQALTQEGTPAIERLAHAGLLRDLDLIGECVARVRCELIVAALPVEAPNDPDTPSLLARLTGSTDRVVAAAASATLAGESRRRAVAEGQAIGGSGLPAGLHERLLWWIAAALRERMVPVADVAETLDRALAEAALRNIAAQRDTDRLEAAAMRLAAAIDPQPDELPALIGEVLADRQVVLFAAVIAHALSVPYELARELVIDPLGDRLWLALRALDLPRSAIARVGFLLCEADPRRDLEAFADALDLAAAVSPEEARLAIAPLRLHPDFRAAMLTLERAR